MPLTFFRKQSLTLLAFALSDEPTISSPGAHAVTVTHELETLCFTWNGDTFKDCALDEIVDVEEGSMISLRLSGFVSMTATATVVKQQQSTLSIAENCQGITLCDASCRNKTLMAYKASGGDFEWMPLCWRHKQK